MEDLTLQSQWNEMNDMIERWQEERQELLVKYCELTEITDFSDPDNNHNSKIQRFCEVMVDYVSVGHFEIFDRLVKQSKIFGGESSSEKSVSLLQEIQMTTEIILDFNDKYISTDDLEALIIDLASLGKTFVRRFAEEDKLVDLLHSANVSHLIGGEDVS